MAYTPTHNCLDYVEIAASDLEANKTFFSGLFAWNFTDYGPDYVAFDDGRLNGGFYRVKAEEIPEKSATLIVFFSEDLPATQTRVEELGGKISAPVFEFPGGKRFHFLGPDSLEYAVWANL